MLRKLFVEHPADLGETYFEHLRHAAGFSATMFVGSLACLVHAIIPGLCVQTGSNAIRILHSRMVTGRAAKPTPAE